MSNNFKNKLIKYINNLISILKKTEAEKLIIKNLNNFYSEKLYQI